MAATNPSKILLKGEPNRKERDAGGAITPGHMLQLDADGDVTVHGTAGGNTPGWFAEENDIAGDDLNHAYVTGEVTQIHAARPGDELYIYLAAGQNVIIGTYLESNGDGTLKAADETGDSAGLERTNSIVAMALEAVDLSASAAVDTRMKVAIV